MTHAGQPHSFAAIKMLTHDGGAGGFSDLD